jgi:hypothetical protein
MKILSGNLITLAEQGHFDGIVQGCNCMCTMGSGLAKEIKDRYPGAWRIDFNTDAGDINKLGNWSEYDTGLFTGIRQERCEVFSLAYELLFLSLIFYIFN